MYTKGYCPQGVSRTVVQNVNKNEEYLPDNHPRLQMAKAEIKPLQRVGWDALTWDWIVLTQA